MTNDGFLRPGSPEAIQEGCTCPILDNRDIYGTDRYWCAGDCPLHGLPKWQGGKTIDIDGILDDELGTNED